MDYRLSAAGDECEWYGRKRRKEERRTRKLFVFIHATNAHTTHTYTVNLKPSLQRTKGSYGQCELHVLTLELPPE
jgi:hypothetical protein